MDGHMGWSFEDFVVPTYQESSDTFAAPDIWGGWTLSCPEKCFIMDHYDAMNHCFSGALCGQIETRSIEETENLNACRDLSLLGARDDRCQLHDFDGIEQMDDIFLSSILEDASWNWCLCSSSELSQKPLDNAFDPSEIMADGVASEGQPPFMISDLSEANGLNEFLMFEPSLEEVVLQNLQRATDKLTDETRKRFRDTFYRLAKNSIQDQVSASANPEARSIHTPPRSDGCDRGDRNRSRRNREAESETNSIDRAVENLTHSTRWNPT